MISIIDYGVGNLNSVQKALSKIGLDSVITDNIERINSSSGIILPGVGAFSSAMEALSEKKLINCICDNVKNLKPLLGICLGMQLLYDKSFENGQYEGLGLIKGEVIKFDKSNKIPHMGWNSLKVIREDKVLSYIKKGDYVYFVHSYYVKGSEESIIALAGYGVDFPAVVRKDNVIGMQFHPEKSGRTGLNLLKAFGEMIKT